MDVSLSDDGTIHIDGNIDRHQNDRFFKSYPTSLVIRPENTQSFIDAIERIKKLLILK
jgi:hypothetical protein